MLKFEKIGRFDRLKSFSNRSHLPQLDRRVSNSLKTAHTFPESRKPTAKKRNATIIDTKTEKPKVFDAKTERSGRFTNWPKSQNRKFQRPRLLIAVHSK